MTDGCAKGHPATMASRNAIENLIQRGLIGVGDETTPKVFLQGLMCSRGSLPQDSVGVFGDVFDLHTGHGAILAPLAPKCKDSSLLRVIAASV
jgi:hypothetical protein